jgi:uncharacterized membrane protein HdeD (DUF308 family)
MTPVRRWILSGTLSKAWWLLALCGILDAMHASINLVMMKLPLTYRVLGSNVSAVWDMGLLALAAGICTIAAGLWSGGRDRSWLLSLHGLAMGAFGTVIVSPLIKGPLSFRPISVLFTVMAASLGAFAFEAAKTQRRSSSSSKGRWFLLAVGAAFIGFAVSFIVVGVFRIRLEPPQTFFIWMSSYLSLCAMFMMWLAFRVHSRSIGQSGQADPFLPAPSPIHTH